MTNAVRDFWLKCINGKTDDRAILDIKTRLECADGFSMSVKAGKYWHSDPEHHLVDGEYSAWEIGFPSEEDELLEAYYRNVGYSMGNVYGYIPIEIVNQIIAKHGGIVDS